MYKKRCKRRNGWKIFFSIFTVILTVIGAFVAKCCYKKCCKKRKKLDDTTEDMLNKNRQVYFIGGGLGSLAGAAYLLRDCNFLGPQIHIIESMKVVGGSNDASGDPISGYVSRGGRILSKKTYENFWELFSTIPSLNKNGKTVTEEIINFDNLHPVHAQARVIDKNGIIQDVTKMGFDNEDLIALGKLIITPDKMLDNISIEKWFKPHFFQTNFWIMWQTTFAFQKWSSVFELKRYMKRMINEFPRLQTLEGVTHTPFNQYDSVILPLKAYLEMHAVDFRTNQTVMDLDFSSSEDITVTAIHMKQNDNNNTSTIYLKKGDLCIVTNGCMTDCSTMGDKNTPPENNIHKPISSELWKKIVAKKPILGNPSPFFDHPDETTIESFTITCKGNKLIKLMEHFSSNIPGSGTLMTFKDSNWLLSVVVPAQPYFKNQPMDITVCWGYGLYPNKIGNYVNKQMKDCTGEEILTELIYHLHMENELKEVIETVINVIPCIMPYVGAELQPHKFTDRPEVVPKNSTNFAMIGQFVEIPCDMVFTEEYSIRAARTAVYKLLKVNKKKVCPVTPYIRNLKVDKNAIRSCLK